MKSCPYCAEEIQDAAIKCRFCGEFLPDDQRSAAAEEAAPPVDSTAQEASFWDADESGDASIGKSVAVQCSGLTQKGDRCRRMVTVVEKDAADPAFCPQHGPNEDLTRKSSATGFLVAGAVVLAIALLAVIIGNRTASSVVNGVATKTENVGVDLDATGAEPAPAEAGVSDDPGQELTMFTTDRGFTFGHPPNWEVTSDGVGETLLDDGGAQEIRISLGDSGDPTPPDEWRDGVLESYGGDSEPVECAGMSGHLVKSDPTVIAYVADEKISITIIAVNKNVKASAEDLDSTYQTTKSILSSGSF